MRESRIAQARRGLTYEQLLVRPRYLKNCPSRKDVDLSTEILPGVTLDIPIIASPMNTISESKMCIKMHELGGLGVLHRFAYKSDGSLDRAYLKGQMEYMAESGVPFEKRAFAVGIKEEDKNLVEDLAPLANIVCIDVNIGHYDRTLDMIRWINREFPDHKIMAGNVSTYEGAKAMFEAGAHCIRATNGGGSACTTLDVAGVGVPTATSLEECAIAAEECDGYVLADGGQKGSGTIVVSLAIGADAVIIGGLLAGSSACPNSAFFQDPDSLEYKARYMGMASRGAQDVRGGIRPGTAPEGRTKTVPVGGKTRVIIDRLVGGVRSGISMAGCRSIPELQQTAEFEIRDAI